MSETNRGSAESGEVAVDPYSTSTLPLPPAWTPIGKAYAPPPPQIPPPAVPPVPGGFGGSPPPSVFPPGGGFAPGGFAPGCRARSPAG